MFFCKSRESRLESDESRFESRESRQNQSPDSAHKNLNHAIENNFQIIKIWHFALAAAILLAMLGIFGLLGLSDVEIYPQIRTDFGLAICADSRNLWIQREFALLCHSERSEESRLFLNAIYKV